MRSNSSLPPRASWRDPSILPRSSSLVKMPSAGGQVPTHTVALASASALEIGKPNPPSSETPATNARLPVKSILSIGSWLPADGRARPREPGAERGEDQQVTPLHAPGRQGFVQRDGDRGGGRVAVTVDIREHLVVTQAQRFLHHLDDTEVRLMGNQELHIARGHPVRP